MEAYDPLIPPDPAAWLELDEGERIALVEAYHEANPSEAEDPVMHAIIHAIVENQIAEGDALPVAKKVRQLMAQGLDRHEAVHAIGCVLAEFMFNIQKGTIVHPDPNKLYFSKLARLTARQWFKKWG